MGMDFRGPAGLKTGVENDMFWSEIGSGFGEPSGTPLPRIPRGTPSSMVSVCEPLQSPLSLELRFGV